jgi:tetratricopeptide (TPR) repeat protein
MVASRNTSFTYKGKAVNARQVSEELGVRYVLEGSVRKQGDTVRITAQLIDGTADAHVWAERFDESGTDIFALQDRVAEKIDGTLSGGEGRIIRTEYQRAWGMDAAKLEEYDYYLRGHSMFYGYTPEAMLKARAIWQEGLEKFPDSGLLRIKIGWTYFQFFQGRWSTEPEGELERAHEWVQEGLADPNLPPVGRWVGHWLNAVVQLYHKRNYELALEQARNALEFAPNDSEMLSHISRVPIFGGHPDVAIEWYSRAISRESGVPDWILWRLGLAYHAKGDCKQAVEKLEITSKARLEKSPALTDCYVELGRLDDARAEVAKLLEAWPDITVSKIGLWLPYKDPGLRDRVNAALIEAGLPE